MLCGVRSEEAEDDGSGSSLITITSGIGFSSSIVSEV